MAGDIAHFWKDIEIRIDSDPFFKSCQIFSMKKKARSKNQLKQKAPLQLVYGYFSCSSTKTLDK